MRLPQPASAVPNHPAPAFGLPLLCRVEEAAHCFRSTSLLAMPEPAAALSNTALSCLRLGHTKAAAALFGGALGLQLNCTAARQGLAYMVHEGGEESEAAQAVISSLNVTAAERGSISDEEPALNPVHLRVRSLNERYMLQPVYWLD